MKISTKEELFDIICTAVEQENLGLFVGAGFSKALLKDNYEYQAYSWRELLVQGALMMEVDLAEEDWQTPYPEIASKICKKHSEKNAVKYTQSVCVFKEKIAELTAIYPAENIREIYSEYFTNLNCNWIVTTNYDTMLESVLGGQGITLSPGEVLYKIKGFTPIYHIHGYRNDYENIVITNEDYAKLFRPNDYRQARLPFLIKESTMLMIGYALGDINVLTACDWAENVYKTDGQYNNSCIIQLLYKENPCEAPYYTETGMIIYEISDLMEFFSQLNEHRKNFRKHYKKKQEDFSKITQILNNPSQEEIEKFVADYEWRKQIIELFVNLKDKFWQITGAFHKYLKNVILYLNKKCSENGNFEAYDKKLKVIFDVFRYASPPKMPPIIFNILASTLAGMARYIGNECGQSFSANRTWQQKVIFLPQFVVNELRIYCSNANSSDHRYLLRLLGQYETDLGEDNNE